MIEAVVRNLILRNGLDWEHFKKQGFKKYKIAKKGSEPEYLCSDVYGYIYKNKEEPDVDFYME